MLSHMSYIILLSYILPMIELRGSLTTLHFFHFLKTLITFINQNLYCLSSSEKGRLLGLDDYSSHPLWILMNNNKYKLLMY